MVGLVAAEGLCGMEVRADQPALPPGHDIVSPASFLATHNMIQTLLPLSSLMALPHPPGPRWWRCPPPTTAPTSRP
jgi:hypothetical protein